MTSRERLLAAMVSGAADLPGLRHVLRPPGAAELTAFREQARRAKQFGAAHGILVAGHYPGVGDPLIWMSGVEGALLAALDTPDVFRTYVEIVAAWSRELLGILLEAEVDVVVRRGWYESTDFWSPELYRTYLAGPLREEIEMAHQAGVRLSYVMNSGTRPLLPVFRALGFDVLTNLDPQAAGTDLDLLKREIGDRICLCGGLNNTRVLEQGTETEVEDAVGDALDRLAPGSGYILAPGDSVGFVDGLDQALVRRNVEAAIRAWKRHQGIA